jgi:acetyl esterase/lipase
LSLLPRKSVLLLLLISNTALWAQAHQESSTVLLWPNGAPGAAGTTARDEPSLTLLLPARDAIDRTQTAILVLPGGGYSGLSIKQEGHPASEWPVHQGIAAFMLNYRVGPRYHYPIERMDAARAMRWIRSHAAEYGINPHRIGVWGFSAGGHLASLLSTQFDGGNQSARDVIDRVSDRPDFTILTYPVIDPLGKAGKGSFTNLLGDNPRPGIVRQLMTDRSVTAETPPTFLVHGSDDQWVSAQNSINFYIALKRAGVPCELHIYEHGDHGFGLAQTDPVLSTWFDLLTKWLGNRGLLAHP